MFFRHKSVIRKEDTILLVVDMQEKIVPLMPERDLVVKNVQNLIKFAKIVQMPIVYTEHYPKGLGITIPEVLELMPEAKRAEKITFSCFGSEEFVQVMEELKPKNMVVCGIFTNVCVLQTVLDALQRGYGVQVIADATNAQKMRDWEIVLRRMENSGATISTTETVIYVLLERGDRAEFKQFLKEIQL
ncbi:MAG TPA: isochorismatase family protein [Clostridia bacterium]|nr:isochorismatase family protein [Clostridia bacterium]